MKCFGCPKALLLEWAISSCIGNRGIVNGELSALLHLQHLEKKNARFRSYEEGIDSWLLYHLRMHAHASHIWLILILSLHLFTFYVAHVNQLLGFANVYPLRQFVIAQTSVNFSEIYEGRSFARAWYNITFRIFALLFGLVAGGEGTAFV